MKEFFLVSTHILPALTLSQTHVLNFISISPHPHPLKSIALLCLLSPHSSPPMLCLAVVLSTCPAGQSDPSTLSPPFSKPTAHTPLASCLSHQVQPPLLLHHRPETSPVHSMVQQNWSPELHHHHTLSAR